MSKVFEGGDGWTRGGMEERSSVRGTLVPFDNGLEAFEAGGDALPVAILQTEE